MAFDSTIGGASANSYASVADADAYFADRPSSSDWSGVSDKEKALVQATDYLDNFAYSGYQTDSSQALAHPRSNLVNREGSGFIGTAVIASDILKACYELALYLDTNASLFVIDDTVTDVKIGPIAIKQERKEFGEYSSLPMNVKRLIDPYLSSGTVRNPTLTRG